MKEKSVHVMVHYGRDRASYEYLSSLFALLFGTDLLIESKAISDSTVEAEFMVTEEEAPLMTELLRYLCNHAQISSWEVCPE